MILFAQTQTPTLWPPRSAVDVGHLPQLTPTMLQPRLAGAHTALETSLTALASSLNALSFCSRHTHVQPAFIATSFARHASHAAQGRANGPGDSAGRRLGAKKTASEYVVPGNIIFKQRGRTAAPSACTFGIYFFFLPQLTQHTYRHPMAPRRQRQHRKRPHHLRDRTRLRALLPRPAPTPQAAVYRSCIGKGRPRVTAARAHERTHPATLEHVRLPDPAARRERRLIPRIAPELQQQRHGRRSCAVHAARHQPRGQRLHRAGRREERHQGRAVRPQGPLVRLEEAQRQDRARRDLEGGQELQEVEGQEVNQGRQGRWQEALIIA